MNQDQEWPRIRQTLVDSINESIKVNEELIRVNKKLVEDNLIMMQNHHDALYGFRNDKGDWVKGVIQISNENEDRRKKMEEKMGWAIYGVLMAVGVSVWDVVTKFWHFITGQPGHS
jgi:hypothetical protein